MAREIGGRVAKLRCPYGNGGIPAEDSFKNRNERNGLRAAKFGSGSCQGGMISPVPQLSRAGASVWTHPPKSRRSSEPPPRHQKRWDAMAEHIVSLR